MGLHFHHLNPRSVSLEVKISMSFQGLLHSSLFMSSLLASLLMVFLTVLCKFLPQPFPRAPSQASMSYYLFSFFKAHINCCLLGESSLDNLFPPRNSVTLNLDGTSLWAPLPRLPCPSLDISHMCVSDYHKEIAGPLRTGATSLPPHRVTHSIIRPGVIDTCVLG